MGHIHPNKSDFLTSFKHFYELVLTQFGKHIKIVRTDNAKELSQGESLNYYKSKGILHQSSCAETPQQNGVVERKHKHLLEVARTLYHQSKVPTMFWGDCVLTAAHTINKMPILPLNDYTPHERLYGTKPSYDFLKVFGCLCFASTLKRDRTKLGERVDPCMFIGYSQHRKGYRLYNLKTKCTLISRDVYFHEKCFPYRFSDMDQTPIKHFFIPRSNYPMNDIEAANQENIPLCIQKNPCQTDGYTSPGHIVLENKKIEQHKGQSLSLNSSMTHKTKLRDQQD